MLYRNSAVGSRRARLAATFAATLAFAFACAEPSSSPTDADLLAPGANDPALIKSVGDELARLRSATARFHDFEGATDATSGEYAAPLTGCMTDSKLGGMGFHYGKASAIDAIVNPTEPEALLYEPDKNGKYRLVAVEFLVPYTLVPRNGPAPVAFGQSFRRNDVFELWTLQAWVWKNNPSGMFEDWNPNVNCDAVPQAARMSH